MTVTVAEHTEEWTRLRWSSREMAERLAAFCGTGSATKRLPGFVLTDRCAQSAIAGLLDADGSIGARDRLHRIFSTSEQMVWQVWTTLVSLGERPCIRSVNRRSGYPNAKPAWTVEWTPGGHEREFVGTFGSFYALPLRRVERDRIHAPVYNIEVEGTHTYLVNGVVVHNCGGLHETACPRVKTMAFNADGKIVVGVEFWPWRKWPKKGIIWRSDVYQDGDPIPELTEEEKLLESSGMNPLMVMLRGFAQHNALNQRIAAQEAARETGA